VCYLKLGSAGSSCDPCAGRAVASLVSAVEHLERCQGVFRGDGVMARSLADRAGDVRGQLEAQDQVAMLAVGLEVLPQLGVLKPAVPRRDLPSAMGEAALRRVLLQDGGV